MSLITPDFGLLFWMILIFGILFFILARFGFPIITGMVDERNAKINDSIRKAEEAEMKLSSLAKEQEEMLERTRQEQARLNAEAAALRDKMVEQAKESAASEADRILAQARERIEREQRDALAQMRKEVSAISVAVAEKIVRKSLSDSSEQIALADKLVDEFPKDRKQN